MDLAGDRRGQSIQIGAVLLFGVLIIAFSSYQAFVVPGQNQEVEFTHNQEVHSDMQDVRNAIVSAPDGGNSRSVSVQLGTQYPSRAIARNPGPASGSLRTVGTTDESAALSIENAQASGETGDFWNDSQSYNTGTLRYTPQYNLYTQAPSTVYENTILYNEFRSGSITLANQTFIDGNDISLVVLNGSVSRSSSQSASLDIQPVSSSTQTVRLSDDGSGPPLTITFVSTRSATYWDFLVDSQSNVDDVTSSGPNDGLYDVTVELADGTYDFQLTKVGVGTQVTDENAAYLTDTDGAGGTVTQGSTTELTLEVRDRYNNPPDNASETTIQAEIVDSGTFESGSKTASKTPDSNGEVTFRYQAPSSGTGDQKIRFSYAGIDSSFDASTPQDSSTILSVSDASSGSTAGGGGKPLSVYRPGSTGEIRVIDADGQITVYGSEQAVGFSRVTDIDADPKNEVIYVDSNGNLKVTSPGQTPTTYINSGNVGGGNIAVGDWDGDDKTEVFYINTNNNKRLYVYEDGTSSPVQDRNGNNIKATAIAGLGDFDSSMNGPEIVYVSNNGKLAYLSNGMKEQKLNRGPNSNKAVSQPADFDDDTVLEVAVVTGNGEIELVDRDKTNAEQTFSSVSPAEIPLGAVDWSGDGTKDVVYADSNNNELLYFEVEDGSSTFINSGGRIVISTNAGTS